MRTSSDAHMTTRWLDVMNLVNAGNDLAAVADQLREQDREAVARWNRARGTVVDAR